MGTSLAFVSMIKEWVNEHEVFLTWMVTASVATLFLSILVTPFIVIRMGEDYFLKERQAPEDSFKDQHPALRLLQ